MKRFILLVLLVLLFSIGIEAQRRRGVIKRRAVTSGTIILSLGPAYCFDDPYASEFSNSILDGHNFQVNLGYRQSFNQRKYPMLKLFSYRFQAHYLNFTGQDILGVKVHSLSRNGGFESYVSNTFELTGHLEYGIDFGARYGRKTPNYIYGFVGLGAFLSKVNFPPIDGAIIYEGKPTNIGALIPLGAGYKYSLSPEIAIGIEVSPQIVFSDYIDGYKGSHVPGTPIVNDNIGTLSFTFYYTLF